MAVPRAVPRLVTDRLVLRPWRPDDERDVVAAYDLYRREEVARFLGRVPRTDRVLDDARERLRRYARSSAEAPDGLGIWALTTTEDDAPVGTAMLKQLPDADGVLTDDVEVGWHLHPDVWGRGYATEAGRALLEHGFGALGLAEIHAVAWPGNQPSLEVMRRLGMERQEPTDRWYAMTLEWWRTTRP